VNNWYVINIKPQKENHVTKRLTDVGFEMLNPKVKDFASKLKPMFPNYIFTRCNFSASTNYHMIKYTRGVNKILGTSQTPVSISEDIINIIKERLNSDDVLEQNKLAVGSQVKVKKGLLKDLIAVIEKPVSAEGRVAVLLRLYEREMKAKLSVKDVELVA